MSLLFLVACELFINPVEGKYKVTPKNIDASAACESAWEYDVTGVVDLEKVEIDINQENGNMDIDDFFECKLDGADFSCDDMDEEPIDGADAILSASYDISGSFDTSTSFHSNWIFRFSCDGSDCAQLSESCLMEFNLGGELKE
jgi:hypothetical protein